MVQIKLKKLLEDLGKKLNEFKSKILSSGDKEDTKDSGE